MRRFLLLLVLALAPPVPGAESIILATTTSTQDSGLLDVLTPAFTAETGIEVKVIAVGTGAALKMGGRGDADAVLVHAPEAEQVYVDRGDLIDGTAVMHNEFVIVGPAEDPARARSESGAIAAMAAIARHGGFVSRGDDSGTHKKELELWHAAGVDPATVPRREETGQGMGSTLIIASENQGYTLTDTSTWRVLRPKLELTVIFSGDPPLFNPYHAHVINPAKHPRVKHDSARKFVDFLVSENGRALIAGYRVDDGKPLFTPHQHTAPAP
ncbi:MAG: substrate-binding domain-containing protein [Planctomycetes bacterium]|nr:substrate-binding domain-containing protein [Planctomycetota bacterium]